MTYATALQLLERFDPDSIAQCVDTGLPRLVGGALLLSAARGESLASYTAPEQERVAQALILMNRALADAEAEINGYVGTRYPLPLTPMPPILGRLACDLARYHLAGEQVTEVLKDRQKAATKVLQDVASGRMSLGADGQTGAQVVNNDAPELVSGHRVWQRQSSGGFL
jgi:phage gp36-like protein